MAIGDIQDRLREAKDTGDIWDEKFYKGIDHALDRIGKEARWRNSQQMVDALEAIADELQQQTGIRMSSSAFESMLFWVRCTQLDYSTAKDQKLRILIQMRNDGLMTDEDLVQRRKDIRI